jgi:hypothetical protein
MSPGKIIHYDEQIFHEIFLPVRQCAAVRTYCLLMRLPPQFIDISPETILRIKV